MITPEKPFAPIRTAVMLSAGDGERLRAVANGRPKCLMELLGVTLLERNLHALKEAGIRTVLLVVGYQGHTIEEKVEQLDLDGLTIRCLRNPYWRSENGLSLMQAREAVSDQQRFLLLMSDHLFDPGTLRDFLSRVPDDDRSHLLVDLSPGEGVDEDDATYVRLSTHNRVSAIGKGLDQAQGVDCGAFVLTQDIFPALERSFAAGDSTLTAANRRLIQQRSLAGVPLRTGFWQDIDTPTDYQSAKKKLLATLANSGDGLVSRYLNRKLSRPLSVWLARTRVTPNQVTLASFFLGLAGAALFALGHPLGAGLTIQLSSIVDGTDGELARLKLRTSPWGGFLDALLDRYADGLILLAMGYYAYTLSPGWLPIALTVTAIFGIPLSMALKDRYRLAFGRSFTSQTDDGWTRYLLPNRDGRLLVVMLGGVTGLVLPALAFIAGVSHLVFLRRLWRVGAQQRPAPSQVTAVFARAPRSVGATLLEPDRSRAVVMAPELPPSLPPQTGA